jgi:hypothetical protein
MTNSMTISEAHKTLIELTAKRVAHVERGVKLAEDRRKISFKAHAGGNEASRAKLDAMNQESAIHQIELENLTAAIDEATKLLETARDDEAQKADRLKAKRLREELLPKLAEHCEGMDEALATLVSHIESATSVVREINAAGAGPIERLFLLNGVKVVNAALWLTPWRQEFRPIPPGERHKFKELLANWSVSIQRRADELEGAGVKHTAARAA